MTPVSLVAELRADVAGLLRLVEDHRQSSREAAAVIKSLQRRCDAGWEVAALAQRQIARIAP